MLITESNRRVAAWYKHVLAVVTVVSETFCVSTLKYRWFIAHTLHAAEHDGSS